MCLLCNRTGGMDFPFPTMAEPMFRLQHVASRILVTLPTLARFWQKNEINNCRTILHIKVSVCYNKLWHHGHICRFYHGEYFIISSKLKLLTFPISSSWEAHFLSLFPSLSRPLTYFSARWVNLKARGSVSCNEEKSFPVCCNFQTTTTAMTTVTTATDLMLLLLLPTTATMMKTIETTQQQQF